MIRRFLRWLFPRPPEREDYLRATIEARGLLFESALEYRDGDDFDSLADLLEGVTIDGVIDGNAMQIVRSIADHIAAWWPDRAYFIEAWREGDRRLAQSYKPFGVPRWR